ncbi:unnamed protein product, partial [Discosporangium mesarthrocarpum]
MQLSRLSLRRNRLSPDAVNTCLVPGNAPGRLAHSLRELDLSSNGLHTVPEALFHCHGLQTLVLAYNALTDLSHLHWAALSVLETLDLSSNRLTNLGGVTGMTWIRHLNLENNDISVIPPELGLCTALESLQLAGNPQRQLSASALEKGTSAILRNLRDRLTPSSSSSSPRVPTVAPPLPLP